MDEMTFDERLIARAAADFTYPPAPQLRGRVLAAIAAQRREPPMPRLRLALATVAAVAVAAFAVVLAVPGSRSAVAEFFGIEGAEVERLPTPAPGETPTPFPEPVGIERIAEPVSFETAALRAGFQPALPPGRGAPRAVYVIEYDVETVVAVLQYADFDIWESRFDTGAFSKGVPAEAVVRELVLEGGAAARWIAGGRHIVTFEDAGTPVAGTQRTVDRNTLVWRTDYAFYRLETDLPFDEAVAVAGSLP